MTQVRAQVLAESAVDYHRRPGESSSRVNAFLRSPRLFQSAYILQEGTEDRESNALDLGRGEHAWVFEPSKFEQYCAIIPDEVLSKRGAKEGNAYHAWEAEQGDKTLLKPAEWDAVKRMRRALYANDVAAELLGGAESFEQTITWTCPESGLPRRSRLDCLTTYRGRPLIVDLKTATDHSPEAFEASCRKWGYFRQAAFYQDAYAAAFGLETVRPGFVFIVVRSKAPHIVRCYSLGKTEISKERWVDALDLGRRQVTGSLLEMADRYETGWWGENGENQICEVNLKSWWMREETAA